MFPLVSSCSRHSPHDVVSCEIINKCAGVQLAACRFLKATPTGKTVISDNQEGMLTFCNV